MVDFKSWLLRRQGSRTDAIGELVRHLKAIPRDEHPKSFLPESLVPVLIRRGVQAELVRVRRICGFSTATGSMKKPRKKLWKTPYDLLLVGQGGIGSNSHGTNRRRSENRVARRADVGQNGTHSAGNVPWTLTVFRFSFAVLSWTDELMRSAVGRRNPNRRKEKHSVDRSTLHAQATLMPVGHMFSAASFLEFLAGSTPSAKVREALEEMDRVCGEGYLYEGVGGRDYGGLDPWEADAAEAEQHLHFLIDMCLDEDLRPAHRYLEYLLDGCGNEDREGERQIREVARKIGGQL
jgi:hypothetical protein